jgi:hypothetical protein
MSKYSVFIYYTHVTPNPSRLGLPSRNVTSTLVLLPSGLAASRTRLTTHVLIFESAVSDKFNMARYAVTEYPGMG